MSMCLGGWVKICYLSLLILLFGCVSCSSSPSLGTLEACQSMVGDKSRLFSPSIALRNDLEESILQKQRYVGILWYTSDSGTYYACTYIIDKNGCGTNSYKIRKINSEWYAKWEHSLEKVCMLN